MEQTTFMIEDLCCIDEERCIRKKFKSIEGVEELKVDLLSRRIIVRHSCPRHRLADALHEIGFKSKLDVQTAPPDSTWEKHRLTILTSISALLLAIGLLLRLIGILPIIPDAIFVCSIIIGGWKIAGKAIRALKSSVMDMNVLMLIAVIGALAIRRFEEASAVIVLFAVSNVLERQSMDRSKRRIENLMDISPVTGTKMDNGIEVVLPVAEIVPGDRLIIRPGERIPLDGKVIGGQSSVDQSPITGESRHHVKTIGEDVYAGSLNMRGVLEIEVLRPYTDTTLARIVRMVEEAQTERAPLQTLGETFARYYTPAVFILAILVAFVPPVIFGAQFGEWFYRALVMLVIACPCALVISTPVTIVSALANAARNGILIKGGRHLEAMASVAVVAFDKTGTLTAGLPRVTDVIPLQSLSEKEILRIAAAVEQHSEHHLAGAVVQKAHEEQVSPTGISYEHFEALAGRGVHAKVDGTEYFIGNHALVEEKNMCSPRIEQILAGLERQGKTTIIIASGDEPFGIIAVEDVSREASHHIVGELHSCGIQQVIMLTGDSDEAASVIARQTKIDSVYSNLVPEEKMERVKMLKERYGTVAMVGDGINDAPALASATVGIAMGAAGTDIAMESADIVLMSDDLSSLPFLVRLSKKTISIIKQNMAIALVTKLIFIGLGITGHASLWMAILADDGATLLVILNGLRALRLTGRKGDGS